MVRFAKLRKFLYFSRLVEKHQTNSGKVSREHSTKVSREPVERRAPSR